MSAYDNDERVRPVEYGYAVMSPRWGLVRVQRSQNGMWAGFVERYEPGEAPLTDAIGGTTAYSAEDAIELALG